MKFLDMVRMIFGKPNYPKDLVMFDFAKLDNKSTRENEEIKRYEEFRNSLSEKFYQINMLRYFKLQNAIDIINKYNNLEKEIWGKNGR